MRELVLSNLIKFILEKDISGEIPSNVSVYDDSGNHYEAIVDPLEYDWFDDYIHENSGYWKWVDIRNTLKFDKITQHLLERFSDAIDREDYSSASVMRKEILNQWEFLNEKDFWEMGRVHLFHLKFGLKRFESVKYLFNDVRTLEEIWVNKGFEEYDYILKELNDIWDTIKRYTLTELNSKINEVPNSHIHISELIDNCVTFFELFKKENKKA
tara:strand:- start:15025 stop:15663 length:639 start_codon:yes stop_codon:yes gene_type:complete